MLGYNNNSYDSVAPHTDSICIAFSDFDFIRQRIYQWYTSTESKDYIMKDEGYIDLLKYSVVINNGSMCHNMPYLHTVVELSCIEWITQIDGTVILLGQQYSCKHFMILEGNYITLLQYLTWCMFY